MNSTLAATRKVYLPLIVWLTVALMAPAQTPTEDSVYRRFGYYTPPESLDYHLWTNWTARTNGRNARLLSFAGHIGVVTATNALWNTNWYFFGCDNATAQTHVRTNAGEAWYAKKSTLISRVLILQSGHNNCGERTDGLCGSNHWYLALDKTNGQHWRRVVHGLSRQNSTNGDYYLAAVENPFPANIATMPVLIYSTLTNKLSANTGLGQRWPVFFNSQFSRTEGNILMRIPGNWMDANPRVMVTNTQFAGGPGVPLYVNNFSAFVTNSLGTPRGGDSGSPTFIVVSNRMVLLSAGLTAPGISSLSHFLADVNTATAAAGFSTNDYPVEIETLSGFPTH